MMVFHPRPALIQIKINSIFLFNFNNLIKNSKTAGRRCTPLAANGSSLFSYVSKQPPRLLSGPTAPDRHPVG
jgi:hypothetical protein